MSRGRLPEPWPCSPPAHVSWAAPRRICLSRKAPASRSLNSVQCWPQLLSVGVAGDSSRLRAKSWQSDLNFLPKLTGQSAYGTRAALLALGAIEASV